MALKREKDRLVHQLKQQVYRPRKQPPSSNIPCTCDAGYSPDITTKYHGSSYDAYMIQRSQGFWILTLLVHKHESLHNLLP
ncbi:uncharacterized protein [Dipodomys merriami]|uniref:uncharacterized protein isoform X3 n=1 Tax=Dipodomys merriami TaxID=94247 RepID=UPI00384F8931